MVGNTLAIVMYHYVRDLKNSRDILELKVLIQVSLNLKLNFLKQTITLSQWSS